ncbi:MAG: DUF3105 domain-containing protein [Acidimicrobiia bacterium]|nr:DUF3105 domain-containing protein [Acidimicrobiia bacterium]
MSSRKGSKQGGKRPPRPASEGRSRVGIYVAAGIGVVAFIGLVAFITSDIAENPQGSADPPPGVEVVSIEAPAHTENPVAYSSTPGAGGPHHPRWLTCQAYDEPVIEEMAVHTLEHGAIWIAYQPDLPEGDIEALEGLTRSSQVMSSPYPGLDVPVVLTAWARQLRMDTVDVDVADQFIRAFRDATAPEANSSC